MLTIGVDYDLDALRAPPFHAAGTLYLTSSDPICMSDPSQLILTRSHPASLAICTSA